MTLHNFHIHFWSIYTSEVRRAPRISWFHTSRAKVPAHERKNIKQNHFNTSHALELYCTLVRDWLKQLLMLHPRLFGLFWVNFWGGSTSLGNVVACFWSSLLCSLFFCHPWSLVHMPTHCSTLLPHHLASPHRQSLTWYLATKPLLFTFSPCLCLPCFLQYIHWKFVSSFIFAVQFQIQTTKPIFTETKMAHGQTSGITSWHWVSPHCRTQTVFLCVFPVEMPYFPDVHSNLQRENGKQGAVIYETQNVP